MALPPGVTLSQQPPKPPPGVTRVPPGVTLGSPQSSESGGSYDHERLKQLWLQAGGSPHAADLMAHVAEAESGGNTQAKNQYSDGGRNYEVQGLWQISTIHGPGPYYDAMTNARKAVELYNAQGLSPWRDSQNKGGNGGWGKFAASDMAADVAPLSIQRALKSVHDAQVATKSQAKVKTSRVGQIQTAGFSAGTAALAQAAQQQWVKVTQQQYGISQQQAQKAAQQKYPDNPMRQAAPSALSGLHRVATVGEFVPEIWNATQRQLGQPGAGDAALNATLGNPKLTLSEKLDAAFNELGINSPGELKYWGQQPGIRDQLANAHPSTPGGAMLQLLLGAHADLARFKPNHPWLTSGQTAVLELFNPTLPAVGKVGSLVTGGLARAGGRFGTAALEGAAARAARDAAQQAAEKATVREAETRAATPHNIDTFVQPQHAQEEASLAGRRATNEAVWHHPTPGGLATRRPVSLIRPPIPTGKPFQVSPSGEVSTVEREAISSPKKTTPGESQRPITSIGSRKPFYVNRDGVATDFAPKFSVAGSAYHQGFKFGYSNAGLVQSLGKAYETIGKTVERLPLINDRYFKFTKKYGPLGEWQASNFVVQQNALPTTNLQNIMSAELYGGLNDDNVLQLHNTLEGLPGYIEGTNMEDPAAWNNINGSNAILRAKRLSDENLARYNTMKQLDPETAARMKPPVEVTVRNTKIANALGLEVGDKVQILKYAPRPGMWEGAVTKTLARGAKQGAGGASARPTFAKRVFGDIADVVNNNKAIISKGYNGKAAMLLRFTGLDHYIQMMKHLVYDGEVTAIPGAARGTMATMPVDFEWPGGQKFAGAFAGQGDEMINLEDPLYLGSGPEGYKAFQTFAAKTIDTYAQVLGIPAQNINSGEALFQDVTSKFRNNYPEHDVHLAQVLGAPGLNGYGIERTFWGQVADANPRLRVAVDGGISKASSTGPSLVDRATAFNDLDEHAQNVVDHRSTRIGDVADIHFSSSWDEDFGKHATMSRAWDTFNAFARMSALYNFVYHPLFNTTPAMLSLLLKHAGMNPAKIAGYSTGLARTLGVGWMKTGQEAINQGGKLLQYDMPGLSQKIQGLRVPSWIDTPTSWMDRAEASNVFTQNMGTRTSLGMPMSDYVRIMSLPDVDTTVAEKFQRAAINAAEWNKRQVFDVQEARLLTYAHHVLVDKEGMDPRLAAREINKAINDYSNLNSAERSAGVSRWLWFYPFMRMQLHYAGALMKDAPQIPTAANSAITRLNQLQGNPKAKDNQITLWSQGQRPGWMPKGVGQIMSASSAAYRFPHELLDMMGASGDVGTTLAAQAKMATGNLSPVPSTAARILWEGLYRGVTKIGQTPQPWSIATGLTDLQQPLGEQAKEAGAIMLGKVTPFGLYPNSFDQLPPVQVKAVLTTTENLRKTLLHLQNIKAPGNIMAQGQKLIRRLDPMGGGLPDYTAVGAAKAFINAHATRRTGFSFGKF